METRQVAIAQGRGRVRRRQRYERTRARCCYAQLEGGSWQLDGDAGGHDVSNLLVGQLNKLSRAMTKLNLKRRCLILKIRIGEFEYCV